MGCVFSRPEFQPNPRIFHVWNVDEEGHSVKPGKIEVTESQLILYQKGDHTIRWPLRSLRRYGFDAELFSFECGRRCPTGPGVYAFKCRRAEVLFNVLQECIQNSGGGGGTGNATAPANDDQISLTTTAASVTTSNNLVTTNTAGNSIQITPVDASGYLEPITANSHLQCPLVCAASRNLAGNPRDFVCIHSMGNEATSETLETPANGVPSTSLANCCSFGSCGRLSSHHYVNKDVVDQCNSSFIHNSMCMMHHYVNSSVISSDPTVHKCCLGNTKNSYVNGNITAALALSPGHLPCTSRCCTINCMNCVDVNTNYAKLDDLLKQEHSVKRCKEQHYYVNIKPETSNYKPSFEKSSPTDCFIKNGVVTSPTGSIAKCCCSHFYANINSITAPEPIEIEKQIPRVNYAVLDLEQTETGNNTVGSPVSASNSGHSHPCSPAKSPEGYAQIDFDRTVALSNTTIPCPLNDDSIRKTRHNAVIPFGSSN